MHGIAGRAVANGCMYTRTRTMRAMKSLIDCSEDMFVEYGLTVHDSLRAIWPH